MPPRFLARTGPILLSCSTCITSIRWSSTNIKHHEPLRILFCGADAFSIYSLCALHKLQRAHPGKIASIDVVCRPDKRVGRGLKKIQEVPIKPIATSLSLPIHQIDTFRSWSPPISHPPNLIITVSFGLLVPARILNSATYGGLNVHPSLLPDLRGPAPLQHALLNRHSHTGVSLQTMHPTKFDHGLVLAQTASPGVPIPDDATPQSLLETLGPLGAEMLVRGISDALFVPPLHGVRPEKLLGAKPLTHAPKITPFDRQIDWSTWTADEIVLRDRVLGRLWDQDLWERTNLDSGKWEDAYKRLRATFTGPWLTRPGPPGGLDADVVAGTPYVCQRALGGDLEVRFATCDGRAVAPSGITVEGGKKGQGTGLLVEQIRAAADKWD